MKRAVILIPMILIIFGCGGKYNLEFAPPADNAGLDEVFPQEIAGLSRQISSMDLDKTYDGFKAEYGGNDSIVIAVVQAPGVSYANDYFEREIVPVIDNMPTNSRGQVNGVWKASGKDSEGRKWFGWTNAHWCFLIHAQSDELFDQAVQAFPFISMAE